MMGFFGVANAYIMRGCLSIAITQMVKKPATDDFNSTDPDTCPYPSDYNPGHDGNSTIKVSQPSGWWVVGNAGNFSKIEIAGKNMRSTDEPSFGKYLQNLAPIRAPYATPCNLILSRVFF